MEDSFFGFDTAAPLDDDGGGRIAEPSEEEYDALNDETFGSAINGDWEEVHETLVRADNHNGDATVCAGGVLRKPSGNGSAGGAGFVDLFDHHSSTSSSSVTTPAHMRSYRQYPLKHEVDSDLEINLSGMKLDDVDLTFDDSDCIMGGNSGINLHPSVWASIPAVKPTKAEQDKLRSMYTANSNDRAESFLREHFPIPFQHLQQQRYLKENSPFPGLSDLQQPPKAPKISTLEDIERNIIIQQTMQKQQRQQQQQQQLPHQQQQQQQQQQLLNSLIKQTSKSPTPTQLNLQQNQLQQQTLQQHQQINKPQQQTPIKGPPGFNQIQTPSRPSSNFANNLAQHPLGNLLQQQQPQQPQKNIPGNRLPPGFPAVPLYSPGLAPHLQQQNHNQLPPHPLLNQHHSLPPNFPHPHQRPLPNPHLPIALNNFAMHPNFNAMRAAAAAAGIHPAALVTAPQQQPRLPPHPPNAAGLLNQNQSNSMYNMFNMRLMQEIQQNHPLLQNVARHQHQLHQQQQNLLAATANALNLPLQHQHHQQQQQRGLNKLNQQQQHHRRSDGGGIIGGANGNLPPEEFDEYANLMSTRDKHWLIGIQLSLLNTDTPYIDDFYYTVYKERKAQLNGDMRHSKAHKDNQLNHPLTQPKGHAQLILVQLGNKNGTRNGQHRERRNSDSIGGGSGGNQDQKSTYVFTPLKFENSLGKLQYGSVTAPRKIIDADIMGSDGMTTGDTTADGTNTTDSATNPLLTSISKTMTGNSTATIGVIGDMSSTTQRKSRHILLHIETLYRIVLKLEDLDNPNAIATIIMKKKKESERILALEMQENANKTNEEKAGESNSAQSLNPALKNRFSYEIETKDALVSKIVAGLNYEKVIAIMNVRKGKALLRRIMPYIQNYDIRWNVWSGVLASLQNVVKKDRDDVDGVLYALYPELKNQIQTANFETMVRVATAIPFNDKRSNGVFCSKFGISAVVCFIIQAETIYVANNDPTLNDDHKNNWRHFLDQVAKSLNRIIQNHTICAAIESDSIQPMMDHFARFKDLKLDSLLALITEAKQQIN